jgi:hypothetical protein
VVAGFRPIRSRFASSCNPALSGFRPWVSAREIVSGRNGAPQMKSSGGSGRVGTTRPTKGCRATAQLPVVTRSRSFSSRWPLGDCSRPSRSPRSLSSTSTGCTYERTSWARFASAAGSVRRSASRHRRSQRGCGRSVCPPLRPSTRGPLVASAERLLLAASLTPICCRFDIDRRGARAARPKQAHGQKTDRFGS